MTSQDHMEGKFAHHGVAHVNKAVGSLFQQQGTTQVRVLRPDKRKTNHRDVPAGLCQAPTGHFISSKQTHKAANHMAAAAPRRPERGPMFQSSSEPGGGKDLHHATHLEQLDAFRSARTQSSQECLHHLGERVHPRRKEFWRREELQPLTGSCSCQGGR